jgi:uncharacterized protein
MATQQAASNRQIPRWRRWLRKLLLFVATPYLTVLLLVVSFQRSLIYVPTRDAKLPAVLARLPHASAEAITCQTADGVTLHGWWLTSTAPLANHPKSQEQTLAGDRPLVIYFCGNAGNRSYRLEEFEILTDAGANVLCCDYRGYGENSGSPSEEGLAHDARAVWKFATAERQVPADRIHLFGESLGGGVATRLAYEQCRNDAPPGGLMLRSTFTNLADVAVNAVPWLPVRWLLIDRYPSIDRIPKVTCPLLVLHGQRDSIIPFELGKRLFAAAPRQSSSGFAPRFVALPTADHNDVLSTEKPRFRAAIHDFLASTGKN